jgi:hypothetical protein
VREPRPPLASVHAELLEPLSEVAGQSRRAPLLVVEDDHADAPGLPVASGAEQGPAGPAGAAAELLEDPGNVAPGPRAEEDERDVEVLGRDDPDVAGRPELAPLPRDEPLPGLGGERKSDEETKPRIAFQARGRSRARQ